MGRIRAARRGMSRIVPFDGAYDDIASIVHIYEPARRTLAAYTGKLLRLRRASDNAESDFAYDTTGELDTATIASWAGGASYVVTIYDQKGGDDITQGIAANQPLFTASAQNGHAGMTFDGTNDYLQGAYTNGGALSQPFNDYAVAKLDAGSVDDNVTNTAVAGNNAGLRAEFGTRTATNPDAWQIYAGGAVIVGNDANSNWNVISIEFSGATSEFWINTVSENSGNAGAANPAGITMGAFSTPSNYWKGLITSIVVVDPVHSDAQRVAFQTIINNYWAVY